VSDRFSVGDVAARGGDKRRIIEVRETGYTWRTVPDDGCRYRTEDSGDPLLAGMWLYCETCMTWQRACEHVRGRFGAWQDPPRSS
jgi:hypothetical protein